MNYSTIQLAKELGISHQTVRIWIKNRWIKPAIVDGHGKHWFTPEQVKKLKDAWPQRKEVGSRAWLAQFDWPDPILEPEKESTVDRAIVSPGEMKFYAPKGTVVNDKLPALLDKSAALLWASLENRKCDLENPQDIIDYTKGYFQFCVEHGIMPSKRRLVNWLGYSLSTFDRTIKKQSLGGQYLDRICDAIKDNLEQAALQNSVNNISAMFILKAQYGYIEANKVILEPGENALGQPKSLEEIAEAVDSDIVDD